MKRNSRIATSSIAHLFTDLEKNVTTPLFRTLFRAPLRRARHVVELLSA